ncbi:MAG: hypothetical protein N2036_13730 [Bryobacteraceae bacterium]|nr:hypothetical protein [Bryobacteraceae bacterium]
MTDLEKVRAELSRYEHLLMEFDAEEDSRGGVELIIRLRQPVEGAHVYRAPLHPRDIAHPQFPWTFQRILYGCLHDYLCELFVRDPQQLSAGDAR